MTEREIIKALECCKKAKINQDCVVLKCPFSTEYGCNIGLENLRNEALDLINRQRAEIERLKCEMGKLLPKDCSYAVQMEVSNNLETKIRAEAIREFADRLKEMKYESIEWAHGEHPYVVEESDIDNLVEEMVGDK